MQITLKASDFNQGIYEVPFGDKKAQFRLVFEDFSFGNRTCIINKIVITVIEFDDDKNEFFNIYSSIIGFGNNVIGIVSENTKLFGKALTKDNMNDCTIILYEG